MSPNAVHRPSRRLVVALNVLALLAVACGGGAAADLTSEEDPAAADDPVAADDTADDIAEAGEDDWPEAITFASIPAQEGGSRAELAEPLVAALTDDLGIEVEFTSATDYAGIIEAMVAGDVEVANFGPFSYVIANDMSDNIQAVAAAVGAPDEEPAYVSYGITRADNDEVDSIEDFAGRTACFVDPSSTSGALYPSAGLLEVGIDPETDTEQTFAGSHDASALAVVAGDCEVGFAYDEMVDSIMPGEGTLDRDDLKVVWESQPIPSVPIAVNTDLPESLVTAIQESVIANDGDVLAADGRCDGNILVEEGPTGAPSCTTFEGNWGFTEVDDSLYDGVRAVCEETQAPACEEA